MIEISAAQRQAGLPKLMPMMYVKGTRELSCTRAELYNTVRQNKDADPCHPTGGIEC